MVNSTLGGTQPPFGSAPPQDPQHQQHHQGPPPQQPQQERGQEAPPEAAPRDPVVSAPSAASLPPPQQSQQQGPPEQPKMNGVAGGAAPPAGATDTPALEGAAQQYSSAQGRGGRCGAISACPLPNHDCRDFSEHLETRCDRSRCDFITWSPQHARYDPHTCHAR